MINYQTLKLSETSQQLLSQLARLTLPNESMMRDDVIKLKHHRDKVYLFIAFQGEQPIAWTSLILPPPRITRTQSSYHRRSNYYPLSSNTKHVPIYTYVKPQYRGKGLARKLVMLAYNKAVPYIPTVFFYTEKTARFFLHLQKQLPKLDIWDATAWWDLYPKDDK